MSKFNWDDAKLIQEKAPDPENRCGGMSCCKDRTYDETQDDCKECMEDYDLAMAWAESERFIT